MEYRTLGTSGLRVSRAGLGCNNFGRRLDAAETARVVERALDLGMNLFDSADIYGGGLSEEYLGKALGARRLDAVVATKFGMDMQRMGQAASASRRYIHQAVEASLRRLGTDWIDLYQIHVPDPRTPIEETLGALDDLVRAGKVRYLGCSNFAAWQLVEAEWVCRTRQLERFVSAQNLYNLLERGIERELVPAARRYGVGVLPYFPLASGFLTGKYRRGEPAPAGTRLAAAGPLADRVLTAGNYERLERLERFAAERGRAVLDLALGWLASQPVVSSVIAGATSPAQLEQNVRATEWTLGAEDLAALERALRPA
jgi:aryl-alcohol dehydrogenase-like predicted oxidoreductase